MGGEGESVGQSSRREFALVSRQKVASERDSLCLRKPEVEVTHAQWLLFLQNKLRGICGEEGGQEGEATGEGELEWPATEQGGTQELTVVLGGP